MLGSHGGHKPIRSAWIGSRMASVVGASIAPSELPTRIVAGPQCSELTGRCAPIEVHCSLDAATAATRGGRSGPGQPASRCEEGATGPLRVRAVCARIGGRIGGSVGRSGDGAAGGLVSGGSGRGAGRGKGAGTGGP